MGGRPKLNVLGKKFGRLVVLERDGNIQTFAAYKCRCDCGNITRTSSVKLARGHTQSCGCLHSDTFRKKFTTHGMSSHPLYDTWRSMVHRCTNPKTSGWKYYGGRGIKVCKRWMDIKNFVEDMYPAYRKGLTLDRINNDGDYKPTNCRWATRTAQNKNRANGSEIQSEIDEVLYNRSYGKWFVQRYFETQEEAEVFALKLRKLLGPPKTGEKSASNI